MTGKYISQLFHKFWRVLPIQKSLLHKNHIDGKLQDKRKALLEKGLPKKKPIAGIKNVIIVASGKGGVGKSTVSVNLAIALKQNNLKHEIGLLDADIFGPCIPLMLNVDEKPLLNKQSKMIPVRNWGIKCMSMGLLIDREQAVVWRGLMIMQALDSLLRNVDWGVIDYLVIDTPPGTGDTHLSLLQNIPISAVVMVTTPQKPALDVTARSIAMFRKMNVNVAGVVNNMSEVICSKCGSSSFNHKGRVEEFSKAHDMVVLANFPMKMEISEGSDTGEPIVASQPNNIISKEFLKLAALMDKYVTEINVRSENEQTNQSKTNVLDH